MNRIEKIAAQVVARSLESSDVSEIEKYYRVKLLPNEVVELRRVMQTAKQRYNRQNTLFSDFDWAHIVEEFLDDKGYSFTHLVK